MIRDIKFCNEKCFKKSTILLSFIAWSIFSICAQDIAPYQLNISTEFEAPEKHASLDPISYNGLGIIQVYERWNKSYLFQLFSNDLKLLKENTVKTGSLFNQRIQSQWLIKLNSKSYLFMMGFFNKTESISAIEFSPENLDFIGTSKNLYQSSGKAKYTPKFEKTSEIDAFGHHFRTSEDKKNFMCGYEIKNRGKENNLGIHVFDENLNTLWGNEFILPYKENEMKILDFLLSNDGKVYVLAKHSNDGSNFNYEISIKDRYNFNYEILIYEKEKKTPKIVTVYLDQYFPLTNYIFKESGHKIVLTGTYSKKEDKIIQGAYVFNINTSRNNKTTVKTRYYEIPDDIMLANEPYEKLKVTYGLNDKKINDLTRRDILIRQHLTADDGTSKIILEQYYYIPSMREGYSGEFYAGDIYVFSLDSTGQLQWLKKLPKNQHVRSYSDEDLSINTSLTGNILNIFFIDNEENIELPKNEEPSEFSRKGKITLFVSQFNSEGEITKYNIGYIDPSKINFNIRYFVKDENNNLMGIVSKDKSNFLCYLKIE